MQIFEEEDERTFEGQRREQLDERLEEKTGLLTRGARNLTRGYQLGEDATELSHGAAGQRLADLDVAELRSKGVGPRTQGQDLLGLVTSADGNAQPAHRRLSGELVQQPRLANSGLPGDQNNSPAVIEQVVEGLT